MTREEAIYCMKAYLPDTNSYTECKKCKYYKSKMDARGCYLCQSSEAHKMAIRSLENEQKLKEAISKIEDELKNSSIGDSVYDSALNHARRLIKKHTEELV